MKSKLYKAASIFLIYFVSSCFIHYLLLPENEPSPDSFPRTGDTVVNPVAGETIRFTKDRYTGEPSRVEIEVEIKASGSIPLAHIHSNMHEVFTGLTGTTHLTHQENRKSIGPGEALQIQAGEAHLPFNPGPGIARVKVSMQPIGVFDLCLVNIHQFLATPLSERSWLHTQLQLARFASFCDVYRSDIPVWIQKVGLFAANPTLRALGYRAWAE